MFFKTIFCALAIIACVTMVAGNNEVAFTEEFQKAIALYKIHKYDEAAKLFGKLAINPPRRTIARTKCLMYQARCLGRNGQYDLAMKVTEKIKLVPYKVMVQMEIMLVNRKRKALIAEYKDTDFSDFPEEIIDMTYFFRGRAYLLEQKPTEAANDFEKAALNLSDDSRFQCSVYDNLADAYVKLKDFDRAMIAAATAQKVHTHKGFYAFSRNAIRRAHIFRDQGKYSEAKSELEKAWSEKLSANLKTVLLMAYAELYIAQNNTNEARENYEKALKIAPDHLKMEIAQKLKNLKIK